MTSILAGVDRFERSRDAVAFAGALRVIRAIDVLTYSAPAMTGLRMSACRLG